MPLLIDVRPRPYDDSYELMRSVIIEGVTVPYGFVWNGASIPRVAWPIIGSPFRPKYMAPSMVHDFLYSRKSKFTRREADKLFRKLLVANGVEDDLADIIYTAVRIGGAIFWRGK